MKVIFKAPQRIGNKSFSPGEHHVPDNFVNNLNFKSLVAKGTVQMVPHDVAAQKIQMSNDVKAFQKAKLARKARASKSAHAVSSASSHSSSSAAGATQPLLKPAKPISAEATVKASRPVASASAQRKGKLK